MWVDSNRDGVTNAGELKSLQDVGVASIRLAATASDQSVKPGENILLATSSFTMADGRVRNVGDAALAYKPGASTASSAGPVRAAGEDNAAWLPGLTAALRAGLDERGLAAASSRSLGLPADANPFDFFADRPAEAAQQRQDIPALLAPASDAGKDASAHDLRVALWVQNMASFGRRSGEANWHRRDSETARFDYFA